MRAQYLTAKATVVAIISSPLAHFEKREYRVEIDPRDIAALGITNRSLMRPVVRLHSGINKPQAPQEGDTVLLQCRITKDSPEWGLCTSPVIKQVIN